MNIELLNEFYSKWDIITMEEEQFQLFKERVNACLISIFKSQLLNQKIISEFNLIIGTKYIPKSINPLVQLSKGILGATNIEKEENIYKLMIDEKDLKKYMLYLQVIFLLDSISDDLKDELYESLNNVIKISKYENIVYIKKDDEYKVLPGGEEFLDKGLINISIETLKSYEKAYQLYIASLEGYLYLDDSNKVSKRDIADKLRLTFESYLKEKFNSDKRGIGDITKHNVKKFFDDNQISPFIKTLYTQLASSFEQYSNQETKHNLGEISKEELEYLIYLLGTFVRLIYTIDKRNSC